MIPYDPDGVQKQLFITRLHNGTTFDMNVDGSVTEQVFSIAPPVGKIWRVSKWMLTIQDEKGFSVEGFGAITQLTNGIEPRIKLGGVVNNLLPFSVKSNGDIGSVGYPTQIHTWGNTDDMLTSEIDFTSIGQFIRLDGDVGDELQVAVKDDLTALSHFYIQAQGYIE